MPGFDLINNNIAKIKKQVTIVVKVNLKIPGIFWPNMKLTTKVLRSPTPFVVVLVLLLLIAL